MCTTVASNLIASVKPHELWQLLFRAAENSIAQDRAVATARIAMSLDAIDDNEDDDSSDDEDVLTPLKLDLKQLLQGPTTLQLKRTPSSFNVSLRKRNLQGKEGQWGQVSQPLPRECERAAS